MYYKEYTYCLTEKDHIFKNWCITCKKWFIDDCRIYEHQSIKKCVDCDAKRGEKIWEN